MLLREYQRQTAQKISALDARILIGHALELSHEELILAADRELSSIEIANINALIDQRMHHMPVAKIIRQKEFYGRLFVTNEHTLDPRPDSETLIDAVLKNTDIDKKIRILDLGTGTGCLILTLLAELPRAQGLAVDLSKDALHVAYRNAENLNLASRIDYRQSDWFENVIGEFDILISNPPYIPSGDIAGLAHDVKEFDPMSALDGGTDGLDPYRIIANQSPQYLKSGGLIAFEVGQGQAEYVADLLQKQGFQNIEIFKDLSSIERVVLAKRG